ncbi:MAG: rRNA maturation RNase YbeY [Actinomycetota bacterium]
MKVNVLNQQDDIPLNLELIEQAAAYISDKFDRDRKCEVNIIFVPRRQIRQLNKQYRQKDTETDVLSFSYLSEKDEPDIEDVIGRNKETHGFYTLGEIIICPAVAGDNASSQKGSWNLNLELFLLIIHGFLHMYGYDHELKEEKEKMFEIQDSMLEDVGKKFELFGQ